MEVDISVIFSVLAILLWIVKHRLTLKEGYKQKPQCMESMDLLSLSEKQKKKSDYFKDYLGKNPAVVAAKQHSDCYFFLHMEIYEYDILSSFSLRN